MTSPIAPDLPAAGRMPVKPRAGVWRRLARRRMALLGLVIVAIVVAGAMLAPWLTGYDPNEQMFDGLTLEGSPLPPNAQFWLGTDLLGRDLLTRILVVPKEEVEKYGADFGKHPVGTGAFKLAEWTLGQRIVFERNADYWHKGLPHLDKITFEIGQEPIVALLRLQKGEIDVPGDGIPPAKFQEVMADPAQKARVVEGGQLHTGYVTMNTTMAPFDNVKVRQAVNMAINKARIVQIINGRAVPANQPLPPSMPGYDKEYKGYPYDVAKAKALLAEAGHPDGFDTQLFVMNTDPNPRIAQAIQQDLAAIGIKASLQSLAQANVIAAGGDKAGAPMIWSGGMAWIADFPDPSNFYGPILGCAGAVPGGWNWSWYCNKDLDAKAAEADSVVDPAKAGERDKMWSAIYDKVMEDAPWAPVFNEQRFTMKSARMGGADNLYVDPVHIPINYDNVYVKDVQ